MTEVKQNDQCCQHRCFNSDSQTLFYLPQKAVLQGADHHTEIYGAHFLLLCSETYTISRETNTGAALIWERCLDVKRQQTTVPIRTAVTRCLDAKVKSYSRSRLHSLLKKTHKERKSLPSVGPVQSWEVKRAAGDLTAPKQSTRAYKFPLLRSCATAHTARYET